MSHETKPTAADLRAYADSWQRLTGSANEPLICRHLRAGADAMDRADKLAAENAELADVLRELMASDEGRGPTEQALGRAAAVLAKRESVE